MLRKNKTIIFNLKNNLIHNPDLDFSRFRLELGDDHENAPITNERGQSM